MPGGYRIRNIDGSYYTPPPDPNYTIKTPGTFLPMQANGQLPVINTSASYHHLVTPSGRGHLSYDIWLQSTPNQVNGFGAQDKTHEIMIPLTYWGDYGKCDTRNPAWA